MNKISALEAYKVSVVIEDVSLLLLYTIYTTPINLKPLPIEFE